jgi:hypothetical protein
MPVVNLQIPLLFDISAGAIVYGETAADIDVFDSHLAFTMSANANYNMKTAFESIMYADASNNDVSGVLFYSTSSSLSTTMGLTIQGAILGSTSKLKMRTAGIYGHDDSTAINKSYMTPGVPLPNYSKIEGDYSTTGMASSLSGQGYYTQSLTDATGTCFGRVLIRLMATHLMGHPFAQSFIANEADIIADISNSDLSTALNDNLLKGTHISAATEATDQDISTCAVGATALKGVGINNGLLQAMYESLLGSAPERFDLSANGYGTDQSGADIDSNLCRPRKLPFETNDTISFYFRPRVGLVVDPATAAAGVYGSDLSGVGQGNSSTSAVTAKTLFFQPRHRWISYRTVTDTPKHSALTTAPLAASNNFDTYADTSVAGGKALAMTGTNLKKGIGGVGDCEFDGHVWKVTLTM